MPLEFNTLTLLMPEDLYIVATCTQGTISNLDDCSFTFYDQFMLNEECLECSLSDGTIVPNGWSGNGVGNNWCNTCFCDNGLLSCTEMWCGEVDCIDDPEDIFCLLYTSPSPRDS